MILLDKQYSKGGLILIKISPEDLNKNEDLKFNFSLDYIQDDDKATARQNYNYIIKQSEQTSDFFKDNNIRKGIAIYYFVNALNYLVQSEKEKKADKNKQNKEKDMKMLETRQVVKEYLENNFGNEPDIDENKKILDNYLKLIEVRYQGFKKFIVKFYNLNAAPPAF